MTKKLEQFIRTMIKETNNGKMEVLGWPYAIPLFHFLSGRSKPNISLPLDQYYKHEYWWGRAPFDSEIKAFKQEFNDRSVL